MRRASTDPLATCGEPLDTEWGMPAARFRVAVALLAPLSMLAAWPGSAASLYFDGFEVGSVCAWSAAVAAPSCCGALLLEESFTLPDGSAWPSPWIAAGNEVAVADVQQERGRLRPDPSSYSLARMVAPGDVSSAEVLFTMVLEEPASQGVGFYARQNGGYLQQTTPFGQGYAVFVEAFRGPGIGLWYEAAGVEQSIEIDFDAAHGLLAGVPYRVRFRLEAPPSAAMASPSGAESHLRGRVWPQGSPEPAIWQVDVLDALVELQGVSGGFAIDSWSNRTSAISAHTLVDDIQIFAVCPE